MLFTQVGWLVGLKGWPLGECNLCMEKYTGDDWDSLSNIMFTRIGHGEEKIDENIQTN